MISYIAGLCSSESGTPSSSRAISLFVTLWATLYITVCTFTGTQSLLSGSDISMLLMACYGTTAIKKPFEDNKKPNKPRGYVNDKLIRENY